MVNQNLVAVSGMNCQIHPALESDKASFLSALSATARYLKSSGIHAFFSFSSMIGKYISSRL